MTYAANWSRSARSAIGGLGRDDMTAVRSAVSVLRGRMPEVGGISPVEGTNLEVEYEIQPKKVLGILAVRPRETEKK